MANEWVTKAYGGAAVSTTLNGGISGSVTSITVTSGSGLPDGSAGSFVLSIDRAGTEEKILVASRSGNTLTVTERGYDGTVAAAHLTLVSVDHVLDAYTVEQANRLAMAMASQYSMAFRGAGRTYTELPVGTEGKVLTVVSGAPAWAADSSSLPLAGGTMTGPILLPDGSVGAPAAAFGDDTDTGVYSPAAGHVAVSLNGVQAFLLDGSNATFAQPVKPRTGTASAGTAPIKFTTGVVNTSPEAGAVEWDGTNLWITTSGGVRKQIGFYPQTGQMLQQVSYQTGALATGTTTIPFDDTIPQITEGNEYMTLAITPVSATSTLLIQVVACLSSSVANFFGTALFVDSTANALAATLEYENNVTAAVLAVLTHRVASGSVTARTYRVRCGGGDAGTTTFNGQGGARKYGGVLASSIVITEIAG